MCFREKQNAPTGQESHFGADLVQIVAPRSINAWFQVYAFPRGTKSSAMFHVVSSGIKSAVVFIEKRMREKTLRTLISTTAAFFLHPEERRAFAVYFPTPGS